MPIPSTVLYSVTVDTEEEWDWNGDYPTTDLRLTNIACLPELQSICNRHRAAVTYFTNYAVLADPVARRIILDLARQPRLLGRRSFSCSASEVAREYVWSKKNKDQHSE
jgi:hypothetical protein